MQLGRSPWSPTTGVILGLLAGVALRTVFVVYFPDFDGDSGVYGTIARNMLLHHSYALDNPFRVTLIRLPGYPLFLAAIFKIFGIDNYGPSRPIQAAIDIASCLPIAAFVRDMVSVRTAKIALWLAVLCPFTANYVAIPMTETISIFCVSLAIFSSAHLVRGLREGGRDLLLPTVATSSALATAILFRPDGVVLTAAVLPFVAWYAKGSARGIALKYALLCALLAAVPFVPWTIRNYIHFKVFQPLAPRFANDPQEVVALGFIEWTKTWLADYVSSPEIYWEGDDLAMNPQMLPVRAFDSPAQREETYKLIADYNLTCTVDGKSNCSIGPELDLRFRRLAQQRFRSHRLRSYLGLPMLRVADMWLRPRTEYLPVPMRWWEWQLHPWGSLFSVSYALLNLLLLLCAAMAFVRGQVPFAGMFLTYMLLRSLLLMTIENAEPRYTLECFPMVLIAAAVTIDRLTVSRSSRTARALATAAG